MSTTTLLQASNEVLRSIGERPLLQMSGVTSDRLRDVFKQAIRDVEAIHTWDWLYDSVPAITWLLDTATLPEYQKVFSVAIGDTQTGYRELQYLTGDVYNRLPRTAYTGTGHNASHYTLIGDSQVKINPYPTDSVSQQRVQFNILRTLSLPVLGTDVFPIIPERYIALLVKRASYLMALRHLDDAQAAGYFNSEYELLTQQYRNNERNTPNRQQNMYRGARR